MGAAANERRNEVDENPGSCWACGYSLRGLGADARRCPDCGRPFDPAVPRSVNRKNPFGWIARRMVVPPGLPTAVVATVAAAMVVWGTGGVAGFHTPVNDLPMLRQTLTTPDAWARHSVRWGVYAAGVATAGAVVAWVALRMALRLALIAWRRPPRDVRRGKRGLATVIALLLTTSVLWVLRGGAIRVGREWATGRWSDGFQPTSFSGPRKRYVVRALAIGGDTPGERRAAIRLALIRSRDGILDADLWHDVAARERDTSLLVDELRFLAFYRDATTLGFLARFLDDPRPAVRAAAADSMGIVAAPAYRIGSDDDDDGREFDWAIAGNPQIQLFPFTWDRRRYRYRSFDDEARRGSRWTSPFFDNWLALSPEQRRPLARMMLEGPTLDERESAARALLPQPPPNYRFRYAEWGVWLSTAGDLAAVRAAAAEEVPPFVHRTGNGIAELIPRVPQRVLTGTKPVIHLSVSEPMSVDVEVRMHQGRPWFAYPMPDDYEIRVAARGGPAWPATAQPASRPSLQEIPPPPPANWLLSGLDPPAGIGTLPATSLRSGYPWTVPPHRAPGRALDTPNTFNDIVEWGVHWQSLIVTPTKPAWTTEPLVGPDPKHAWWRRLRDVKASWVSSRGEGERFLYYDGPTLVRMPFTLRLDGDTIRSKPVVPGPDETVLGAIEPERRSPRVPGERVVKFNDRARTFADRGRPPKTGWFALAVRAAGAAGHVESAEVCPWADDAHPFDRADHLVGETEAAAAWAFWDALKSWGLTDAEAAGLIDVCRERFFERPGARVLVVLPTDCYDQLCPLSVFPEPTEGARVGIVVMDLSPPPPESN